ncbi:hypothetical protein N8T08_010775 [Aspergillus melleus]|uniref:Uncharacterized protein n=1 Tax=Aspergillus melleus TaxID=138277 RepID=A0ACC3BC54_9EURO|nr:hypothetical protein N8T08_010775 [Aspergillus melleus]
MSYFPFSITEHVIDGQYIREYPRATVSQSARLKLVVKKYTPTDNPNPQPGDVTIVGAHGGGFPKELYEPLWEDLLAQSHPQGFRIGSIWIADTANLGASGIINENDLGDDHNGLHLNQSDPPVTLASSKHQEVMQYIRPNFGAVRVSEQMKTERSAPHDTLDQPDVIGPPIKTTPFYRSEPAIAWKLVDHIRPSVLYIFGEQSPISTTYIRTELAQRTGAGIGGNGGTDKSKVKESLIARSGHQAPLEDVRATASSIGEWIGPAVREWKEIEERVAQTWANQTAKDKLSVSTEWLPALESACRLPAVEPSKL